MCPVRDGHGADNMAVWRVATGELVFSTVVKRHTEWQPQWNDDESLFARMTTNTVYLHDASDLSQRESQRCPPPSLWRAICYSRKTLPAHPAATGPKETLHLENVSSFRLSPNPKRVCIAAFLVGKKVRFSASPATTMAWPAPKPPPL